MAQPVPSRNRARGLVARSLAGCAATVAFLAAGAGSVSAADGRRVSDTENTRTVYLVVVGLVLVGCALLAFTMWFWKATKSDHEALGPLEVLGGRRFRGRPPEQRLAMLDTARPVGAIPLGSLHGSDDGLVVEPAEIPAAQPAPEEPSVPAVLEPVGAEVAGEQLDDADSVEAVVATADESEEQAVVDSEEPAIESVESVATDEAEPEGDASVAEEVADTSTLDAPVVEEEIAEPEVAPAPVLDDEVAAEPEVAVVEPGGESDAADPTVPGSVPMNGDHPRDDAADIEIDVVPVPEPASAAQPVANGVEPIVDAPVAHAETEVDVPEGSAAEEPAVTAVTTDTIEPHPVEPEPVAATEPNHDDRGTVRSWLSSMWRR